MVLTFRSQNASIRFQSDSRRICTIQLMKVQSFVTIRPLIIFIFTPKTLINVFFLQPDILFLVVKKPILVYSKSLEDFQKKKVITPFLSLFRSTEHYLMHQLFLYLKVVNIGLHFFWASQYMYKTVFSLPNTFLKCNSIIFYFPII